MQQNRHSRILQVRAWAALFLSFAMLFSLCSCASMLERSESNAEVHADYPVAEDDSTLRVESYQALVNSILYFINEHSSVGSMRLYNYEGDAAEDMAQACAEVTATDPLAAYAVKDLTYEVTRILTYYEVDLQIEYAHTQAMLDTIRTTFGSASLRNELESMVENRTSQTVLLLSYYSGTPDQVKELFSLARYSNPLYYSGPVAPTFQAIFYPEENVRRVLEITVGWRQSPRDLELFARDLSDAASSLMAGSSPAGSTYTVEELAAILRSHVTWEERGSTNPLDALNGLPSSNDALILAMEYLCQLAEIDVQPVLSTDGNTLWLIVGTPDGYRHLLPQGLIPPEPEPEPEPTPVPEPEPAPAPGDASGTEPGLEGDSPATSQEQGDALDSAPEMEPTAALPVLDASPAPETSAQPEDPDSPMEDSTSESMNPEGSQQQPEEPPPPPEKAPEIPLLYTDTELRLMGYRWNTLLYPSCVDTSPPEEAEPPETPPAPPTAGPSAAPSEAPGFSEPTPPLDSTNPPEETASPTESLPPTAEPSPSLSPSPAPTETAAPPAETTPAPETSPAPETPPVSETLPGEETTPGIESSSPEPSSPTVSEPIPETTSPAETPSGTESMPPTETTPPGTEPIPPEEATPSPSASAPSVESPEPSEGAAGTPPVFSLPPEPQGSAPLPTESQQPEESAPPPEWTDPPAEEAPPPVQPASPISPSASLSPSPSPVPSAGTSVQPL